MAKPTITTRATKGSALTWTEGDANLVNLQTASVPDSGTTGQVLTKSSNDDWDFAWADASSGSDYDDADARAALSGSFGINYNNSTGDIKLINTGLPTPYTGTVVSIDGDANTITLNSVMGLTVGDQIVFTGAELSGTNINSGSTYYITNIDMPNTKIQINSLMMGALDINSLSPSGTITWEASSSSGGGTTSYKLTYSTTTSSVGWQPETTASVSLSSLTDTQITMPANGDVLTFDSSSFKWKNLPASGGGIDLTDISVTDSGGDGSLSYDNTTGVFTYTGPSASEVRAHFSAGTGISITDGVITNTVTDTGITDLVQDTTPQLGGNLDVNSNSIVSASNGNINITPNGTGKTVVSAINYNEGALYDLGTTGGTVAPDVANGNVQKITLSSALTINGFTSPVAGQSLTLIIYGGTSYTAITSTMKFAGGDKSLTATAGCIDILSIYYDGTNYFASLGKGFA
jgi:hypothetical protein